MDRRDEMEQSIKPARPTLRVRFSVCINSLQLEEILHRMKCGDKRSLSAWVEHGLRLALAQPIQKPSVSGEAPEPAIVVKSRVAVAWQAYEESLAVEERRANAAAGERRTEEARDA